MRDELTPPFWAAGFFSISVLNPLYVEIAHGFCVLSEVAQGVIYGFGTYSCIMGLDAMMDLIARKNSKG